MAIYAGDWENGGDPFCPEAYSRSLPNAPNVATSIRRGRDTPACILWFTKTIQALADHWNKNMTSFQKSQWRWVGGGISDRAMGPHYRMSGFCAYAVEKFSGGGWPPEDASQDDVRWDDHAISTVRLLLGSAGSQTWTIYYEADGDIYDDAASYTCFFQINPRHLGATGLLWQTRLAGIKMNTFGNEPPYETGGHAKFKLVYGETMGMLLLHHNGVTFVRSAYVTAPVGH